MIIYMDQFAWVWLAQQRAASGDEDQHWQRLKVLRNEGNAIFVLSAANYLETWHRRDPSSRHALARAMRDLTDYMSISPVQKVTDLEIEYFLLRNFRSEGCDCPAVEPVTRVFGRGVTHAFDSPTGRLRLVERTYSPGAEEGPWARRRRRANKAADSGATSCDYEWWSLPPPLPRIQPLLEWSFAVNIVSDLNM